MACFYSSPWDYTIPTILDRRRIAAYRIAAMNGLRVHFVKSIVHFKWFRLALVTGHFSQEFEHLDNKLFCRAHANHEWGLCGWVRVEVFISSLGRLDRLFLF